jgi:hypothetical protein
MVLHRPIECTALIGDVDSRVAGNRKQSRSLPASRHINTNPGSMSDIVISKCLRAHYLYEAFGAGLAEVQHPQTMLRADFLEDWP